MSGDDVLADIFSECERKGIFVQRVRREGKMTAVVEDVPPSLAQDIAASGLTVRGVVIKCRPETVDASAGAGGDGLGEPKLFPLGSTTGPAELGELGVGIGLYFEALLWAAKLLGGIACMSFLAIVVFLRQGSASSRPRGLNAAWVQKLTCQPHERERWLSFFNLAGF